MRVPALQKPRQGWWKATYKREDDISSSVSVYVISVTVVYLLQSHHDSQALGDSGIVELRESFGSLRPVYDWYQQQVEGDYGCSSGSSETNGLEIRRGVYLLFVLICGM